MITIPSWEYLCLATVKFGQSIVKNGTWSGQTECENINHYVPRMTGRDCPIKIVPCRDHLCCATLNFECIKLYVTFRLTLTKCFRPKCSQTTDTNVWTGVRLIVLSCLDISNERRKLKCLVAKRIEINYWLSFNTSFSLYVRHRVVGEGMETCSFSSGSGNFLGGPAQAGLRMRGSADCPFGILTNDDALAVLELKIIINYTSGMCTVVTISSYVPGRLFVNVPIILFNFKQKVVISRVLQHRSGIGTFMSESGQILDGSTECEPGLAGAALCAPFFFPFCFFSVLHGSAFGVRGKLATGYVVFQTDKPP